MEIVYLIFIVNDSTYISHGFVQMFEIKPDKNVTKRMGIPIGSNLLISDAEALYLCKFKLLTLEDWLNTIKTADHSFFIIPYLLSTNTVISSSFGPLKPTTESLSKDWRPSYNSDDDSVLVWKSEHKVSSARKKYSIAPDEYHSDPTQELFYLKSSISLNTRMYTSTEITSLDHLNHAKVFKKTN